MDQICDDQAWQAIDAVRNDRIWLIPDFAKTWGNAMPHAMALGELWMAQKLYPDRCADIDMTARANAYYQRFYRTDWQP